MAEKIKLYNIQATIMKKIIDDERCQNFFGLLINNEKELGQIVDEPLQPVWSTIDIIKDDTFTTEKIENKKADIMIDHSSNYNQNDKY